MTGYCSTHSYSMESGVTHMYILNPAQALISSNGVLPFVCALLY